MPNLCSLLPRALCATTTCARAVLERRAIRSSVGKELIMLNERSSLGGRMRSELVAGRLTKAVRCLRCGWDMY